MFNSKEQEEEEPRSLINRRTQPQLRVNTSMGQNRGHEEVSRELQTEEEALRELLSDHNSRHSL